MLTAVVSLHILISLIIGKEPYDLRGCHLVPERKYLSLYNKSQQFASYKMEFVLSAEKHCRLSPKSEARM